MKSKLGSIVVKPIFYESDRRSPTQNGLVEFALDDFSFTPTISVEIRLADAPEERVSFTMSPEHLDRLMEDLSQVKRRMSMVCPRA